MNAETAYQFIERGAIMSGMRGAFTPAVALDVTRVLMEEDINVFEFTTNSVQPFEAMQAVKKLFGKDACVGMGTVLDSDMAQRALDAGADFVVAPSFSPAVVELAKAQDILVIPGVMTPTECVDAWSLGVKLLKIFPVGNLGVDYFASVRGPLDHIKFICNGGMTGENAPQFIKAGAVAAGMAAWVTGDGTWPLDMIRQRARIVREDIDAVRSDQKLVTI